MTKRILSLFLAVLTVLSLCVPALAADAPAPAASATSGTTGSLTWSYAGGTLTISGKGPMPDYQNYYLETSPWKDFKDEIVRIVVGEGVTSIGGRAFANCSKLVTFNVPSTVTSIGYDAFSNCSKLVSITLNKGLISISNYAFRNCSSLTKIVIPDGVGVIDDYTFSGCSKLTSITIPNSVAVIGTSSFSGCKNLSSVTIPDSVISIDDYAFQNCDALASVTIPGSVTSIGAHAFDSCDSLSAITIPNGVTSIGEKAFADCKRLASVGISETVVSIGKDAFNYSGVAYVMVMNPDCSIYSSKGTLGDPAKTTIRGRSGSTAEAYAKEYGYTFTTLTTVDTDWDVGVWGINDPTWSYSRNGDTLTISGTGAMPSTEAPWSGQTKIKKVIFESGVTSIPNNAFKNHTSLTSVTLPSTVKTIGRNAFLGCKKLAGTFIKTATGLTFYLSPTDAHKMSGGFVTVNNKKYYLSASDGHVMKGGFVTVSNKQYYLAANDGHVMKGGTVKVSGKLYYLNASDGHVMMGGWIKVNGVNTYYAGKNGVLYTGTATISGKKYTFDSNGKLVSGGSSGTSKPTVTPKPSTPTKAKPIDNVSKVHFIRQSKSSCRATSAAMAANLIVGSDTYSTWIMRGKRSSTKGFAGFGNYGVPSSYKGSDGATYIGVYSHTSNLSELKAVIKKSLDAGIPIVVPVVCVPHPEYINPEHYVVLVGWADNGDYLMVDPGYPSKVSNDEKYTHDNVLLTGTVTGGDNKSHPIITEMKKHPWGEHRLGYKYSTSAYYYITFKKA